MIVWSKSTPVPLISKSTENDTEPTNHESK